MNILRFKDNIPIFLLILIFITPIHFFGINDLEEYQLGFFSSKILWERPSNLFTFFFDFYGPGTKFPLGHGPLFHPFNLFISNIKIYYFFFIFSHLLVQVIFTKRLLKLFQINYSNIILAIILIFSLPNILNAISDDWISEFFGYCMFPLIFYYTVKIIDEQKRKYYLKFSLFFFLWIINGHLGIITVYIVFLIIYFLLSVKSISHLKKIFNFSLIISIVLITAMLSDHIFYLIREQTYFDAPKAFQVPYSKRPFLEIFLPFSNFLSWWPINRLPGNPILIYFSILVTLTITLKNIYEFIKKNKDTNYLVEINNFFFKKVQTDLNFKLCLIFGIFLIFSLTTFLNLTKSISGPWWSRDIFLYVGIFIYFINIKKLKKNFQFILNTLIIFYSFLYFSINVINLYNSDENNFILDKYKTSDFKEKLYNLNLKKSDYKRIYLSPNSYEKIRIGYKEEGIFAVTDLINFNLAPFNGWFKNTTMKSFGAERKNMHGWIGSSIEYINNDFFLNLFNINYLLITEEEISLLDNKNLILEDKISTKEHNLILYKINNKNFSIDNEGFLKLKKYLSNCKILILDCILNNKKLFKESNYSLDRLSNGKFLISTQNLNDKNLFLPFIYDDGWQADNSEFENLYGFLVLKNIEKSKQILIFYQDKIRLFLKLTSYIFLIINLILIYYSTSKKFNY